MKILAFLQNQWFKDPDKAREVFARNPAHRNQLIKRYLFLGCLSGRRLREALGEDLCERIIWEETSTEIGGKSSSAFVADLDHMRSAISSNKPDVVICFGKVAGEAMRRLNQSDAPVCTIYVPHPSSRNDPIGKLREIPEQLKWIGAF